VDVQSGSKKDVAVWMKSHNFRFSIANKLGQLKELPSDQFANLPAAILSAYDLTADNMQDYKVKLQLRIDCTRSEAAEKFQRRLVEGRAQFTDAVLVFFFFFAFVKAYLHETGLFHVRQGETEMNFLPIG
jgi:hypothetical protein